MFLYPILKSFSRTPAPRKERAFNSSLFVNRYDIASELIFRLLSKFTVVGKVRILPGLLAGRRYFPGGRY